MCRGIDLSPHGIRLRTLTEPDSADDAFSVEFCLPGDDESLWVWTRRVWRNEAEQALAFCAMHERDRERLDRYLASVQ